MAVSPGLSPGNNPAAVAPASPALRIVYSGCECSPAARLRDNLDRNLSPQSHRVAFAPGARSSTPGVPQLNLEQPTSSSYPSVGGTAGKSNPGQTAEAVMQVAGVPLPSFPVSGGCCGGPCLAYMKLDGNLALQWGPPDTGGLPGPKTLLTYNSSGATTAGGVAISYGHRWYNSIDRKIVASASGATLTSGSGAELFYSGNPGAGSYYTPPAGAANALQRQGSSWIEYQPDGFRLSYIEHTANAGRVLDSAQCGGRRLDPGPGCGRPDHVDQGSV